MMLRRCLPLLLSIPLIADAAPQRLSPEQAFDLYAMVLLENNARAAYALRAARPKDSLLTDEALSRLMGLVPSMVEQVAKEVPGTNIPASLAAEYGELIVATYARSRCRATGRGAGSDRPAAGSNSDSEVTVTFSCQVPTWDTNSGKLSDPVVRQRMLEDDAFAIRLLVEGLRDAPTHTITGTASITGSAATGYFPEGLQIPTFGLVIQSVLPMALLESSGNE